MKSPLIRKTLVAVAGIFIIGASAADAQTLLLRLQAANYDLNSGVWTDTSGNGDNATVGGAAPTLVTGVTPNGSSAVAFNSAAASGASDPNNYFTLATPIAAASGYTAFVFLQPNTTSPNGSTNGAGGTIFGGDAGSFQYRISSASSKQDIVQANQSDLGASNTALPINPFDTPKSPNFSSINTTTSTSGGTYRLNGSADGTSGASNYSATINLIGTNRTDGGPGGAEYFSGDIAEIRIYSGILSDIQRLAIENEFTASYITPIPEPSTWAMMLGSFGMLFGMQRLRSRKA